MDKSKFLTDIYNLEATLTDLPYKELHIRTLAHAYAFAKSTGKKKSFLHHLAVSGQGTDIVTIKITLGENNLNE